jgi:lipopolysaccharide biosynthesis glycosyltransferase
MTKPSISFFCCIESGPLETNVIRMVESLRRWGGQYKDAPVLAITPRPGGALLEATRLRLMELGVTHQVLHLPGKYTWFRFMNKAKAFKIAHNLLKTEILVWLDSDTLIVDEPKLLDLPEGIDFAACATAKGIAVSDQDASNEPYWESICKGTGVQWGNFPWVDTWEDKKRIRCYWNSGVVAFRRTSGLGEHYFTLCERILSSGIQEKDSGIFYTDQVALALAMMDLGLKFNELPLTYNFTMRPDAPCPELLPEASVIHYRGSMWPPSWDQFLGQLKLAKPEVYEWLEKKEPLSNPSTFFNRGMTWLNKINESFQTKAFLRAAKKRELKSNCDRT